MRTEVYSWRLSAGLKAALEQEARRRGLSLSALLDEAARSLLIAGEDASNAEQQRRLQEAALACCGAFAGGDARRSEKARQTVRERVRRRGA